MPKDFTQLCKFGEGTENRKKAIEKLATTYGIELDNNIGEEEINNDDTLAVTTEFTPDNDDICTTEESSLKALKEIDEVDKILSKSANDKIYSTGDKYTYIIADEMSKLWNIVLREAESNSTETIDKIKNSMWRIKTPFKKELYTMFINEYDEVVNLQIH